MFLVAVDRVKQFINVRICFCNVLHFLVSVDLGIGTSKLLLIPILVICLILYQFPY